MTTISQLIMTDDYEMQNLIPVKKKNLPQQPSYEHHSSKRIKWFTYSFSMEIHLRNISYFFLQ